MLCVLVALHEQCALRDWGDSRGSSHHLAGSYLGPRLNEPTVQWAWHAMVRGGCSHTTVRKAHKPPVRPEVLAVVRTSFLAVSKCGYRLFGEGDYVYPKRW